MGDLSVSELLAALEAKAAQSERDIRDLEEMLATERRTLEDVRREMATVRSAVQRVSGTDVASAPADTSWRSLTHVDAVETALREAGHSLHLSEIANELARHGHEKLPKDKISANLTHLSQVRGSVVNVGRGRWDFVRPKPDLRVVADPEELPSQGGSPDLAIPVAGTGSPIA